MLALLLCCALLTTARGDMLTSSFSLVGGADVVLSGGASLAAAPLPALRSGSPDQHSLVQFVTPLSPGVTLEAVSFEYSYSRGYSGNTCRYTTPCKVCF